MRSVPCVRSWHSLDHLPFNDGWLVCPLAFRHKKGEYFVGFLFSRGVYSLFSFGWSLWSLDCIYVLHFVLYIFNSCHIFDGIFMLGGVLCFVGTLYVSCFKLLIDLYL